MQTCPVITIDGPSGAGKGTLSSMLANHLGWHFLDSGAIYRVLAIACVHHDINLQDEESVAPLASSLDVQFLHEDGRAVIMLEGEDVANKIRTEEIGAMASKVAAMASVREALLRRQRAFAQAPGLVADGRDMGTVVFPTAEIKIFLTASAEERAQRRLLQLQDKGLDVNIATLLKDIQARDERDRNRSIAPLIAAEDAFTLDSTGLCIDEVFSQVLRLVESAAVV